MFYWISFIIIALFFCYISLEKKLDVRVRKFFQAALIFTLVYFSAFRDGLGQDYENYYNHMAYGMYNKFTFVEPAHSLFSNIVYFTSLSPIFYFLIAALITNYFFIKSFYRYRNTFLIVFIFLTGTIFYFNTFNLIRQMCAASIFMYSIQFIEKRKFAYFLISVLLASSFHISAVFLIPTYFIAHRSYSKIKLLLILFISIFAGQIIRFDLSSFIEQFIGLYDSYFEGELKIAESGYITLFFNIVLILLIFNKKKNKEIFNIIPFNFFFTGVLLYNLVPSFFYLSRFAIYFVVFAPIVLPTLDIIFPKRVWTFILLLGFGTVFLAGLYYNLDNPKIIPSKMLELRSIFDS